MLNRFANVIYWLGVIIALLSLGVSAVLYSSYISGGSLGDGNIAAMGVAAFAIIAYGVGWATRYILTGRLK